MTSFKCLKCGYEWISRKESPRSCPRCKRYDYLAGLNHSFIVKAKKEEVKEEIKENETGL